MCRNIKPLYNFEPPATDAEIHEAALQFVRKVSGFRRPSRLNTAAFETAVEEVAAATARLIGSLESGAPPRRRAVETAPDHAHAAGRVQEGLDL